MSDTARNTAGTNALLEVSDLAVEFPLGRHRPALRAVDGVSLTVGSGEAVGLVGESGSGKSTIGRAILGLTPITGGRVSFAGADISHLGYRQRQRLSADLQVVFQDPYSSFNPTRTIGQTLAETLRVHGKRSKAEIADRVTELLGLVGLPGDAAARYPAHFSGGQRQRIAVARALMAEPRLIICDEPVSALDLSVQAQVLNLLRELQAKFRCSYLFIAHDLAVVRHLCHRIVVLYRGRIMEQGDADTIYEHPVHPYTQALLEAAPVPDPQLQRQRRAGRRRKSGALPPGALLEGCPFAPRCAYALDECHARRPPLEMTPAGSLVSCHRWREIAHQ